MNAYDFFDLNFKKKVKTIKYKSVLMSYCC